MLMQQPRRAVLNTPRMVVEFRGIEDCGKYACPRGGMQTLQGFYVWNVRECRAVAVEPGDYIDVTDTRAMTVIPRDVFLANYTLPEYDLSGFEVTEK
jgi:hypothetical protein